MDKLVESLRVLLENERDGVLHVDGERLRQAKYAGSVEVCKGWVNFLTCMYVVRRKR